MNAKPLALVFVIVGLAAAAWFAWRGGDQLVVRPGPTTENADTPGSGTADVGQGGVAADPAIAESMLAAADASERTAVATAGEVAAAARVTIRGRLIDGAGLPLADVAMTSHVFGNPDRIDFAIRRDGAAKQEFHCGADGRFAFGLAAGESATLELPSSDLVFDREPPTIHGYKGNQDLGDLVVKPSAVVAGIVRDERGSPVAGVKVTAGIGVIGFGGISSDATGDDGRFRLGKLRAGTWTLRTASAQHLPITRDLAVESGVRIDDLVLVVSVGQAIAGQVVDDLGRGVPEFRVGAKRTEARGGIDVERFAADEAATTDANGFFTLAGLDGDTATVRAFGPGHSSAIAAGVKIGTGNLLLRVERLAIIEGVLRGADGGALAGSTVRAVAAANDEMLTAHGIEGVLQDRAPTARTAADGSFRIEGVRPGTVTVAAEGKGHRPARQSGIQVAPAQVVRGVQLLADRGAVVHVTVVDEDGSPVASARVSAKKPAEAEGQNGMRFRSRRVEDNEDGPRVYGLDDDLGSAVTDAAGRAVIEGLPAGSVALHAEHDRFAAARPVTLPLMPNGSIETSLTLRRPGYAELHITGPDGAVTEGAAYSVRGPLGASDSATRRGVADREGKAVVGPLAAGNYVAELTRKPSMRNFGGASIMLAGDEGTAIAGSEQRFTVVAEKTVTVELRRPILTRVFGTVTGVDGPVAGCAIEIEPRGGDMPSMPDMGGARSVSTAADGTFSIADVERGDYVLRYGRPGQLVKAEVQLRVPAELPDLRQDLVLRTGRVRVQVWSQVENRAIAGAEVAISRAMSQAEPEQRETRIMMVTIATTDSDGGDSTMMTIGGQRAKTGADGFAEIEDVPVGDYDVRVTHGSHAPGERKAIVVQELQTTDVGRIDLTQAGTIRGRVIDADGNPVGMGMVFHRPIGGQDGQPTPAMGGSFTIKALPPGRYVLRGEAMGSGGPAGRTPDVEVEVKGGETATADLHLQKK